MTQKEAGRPVWRERLGKHWIPLENASKIFLATYNGIDTKVYRYTVELKNEVDPDRLQRAVDKAYDDFDWFHATIRRGIFWYYFEDSDLRPVVALEKDVPCSLLYTPDYRGLLFRVLYRKNRIHLEIFHALADGSGSHRFLTEILCRYLGSESEMQRQALSAEHMKDGFQIGPSEKRPDGLHKLGSRMLWNSVRKKTTKEKDRIVRITGVPTIDGRMQVHEIRCDTKEILKLAKLHGTTATVYLTALFMQAIEETLSERQKKRADTVAIALSVDLRQFFPSETARNFFATVVVKHRFRQGMDDTRTICEDLATQFREQITAEAMEEKVRKLLSLEENLMLRVFPRPIKDGILKIANAVNNWGITGAMTNTGRLNAQECHGEEVVSAGLMTAAVRPQFSVLSHGDAFTITFTSPFQNDEIQNAFCNRLKDAGLTLAVFGNRIYEREVERTLAIDDSPYPDIPPRYNAKTALLSSLLVTGLILMLTMLVRDSWIPELSLRFVLVLMVGLWAVVLSLLYKRRNPNKALLYMVLILTGLSALWDFLSGWSGWSVQYALPLIVLTALVAALIAAKASRLKTGDTILYLQGVAVVGLIPLLLVFLRIVDPVWPSLVASIASISILLFTIVRHRVALKEEIQKRFHF